MWVQPCRVLATFAVLAVAGCGGDETPTPTTTSPPVVTTAPAPPTADTLRSSAAELWDARQADDFEVQYRFQDPEKLADATFEQFRAWAEANEPFSVETYSLEDVVADGSLGWVQVNSRMGMRKFPDLPARDSVRWETWRFMDDAWRPVPADMLEQFPVSPRLRDAASEGDLAQRFAVSWVARKDRDWDTLYELSDPRDRPEKPTPEQQAGDAPFDYIDHDVEWIQVVADSGVVRVKLVYRINDPSLSKLPSQAAILNDRWIRVDGEWYLDSRGPGS